jgi:hypothetical protein
MKGNSRNAIAVTETTRDAWMREYGCAPSRVGFENRRMNMCEHKDEEDSGHTAERIPFPKKKRRFFKKADRLLEPSAFRSTLLIETILALLLLAVFAYCVLHFAAAN